MQVVTTPKDGEISVFTYLEGIDILKEELLHCVVTTKGKEEYAQHFANIIMTFDIETTKVLNENYDPATTAKMYKYFNVIFCWQCSINGKFVFGRDITDFFKMIDHINSIEGLPSIICYIHNMAYEMGNLKDYFFSRLNDPEKDAFFKSPSTALYLRLGYFQFQCTKELTHKSLAKIGKDIGYPKLKGDFDYNTERYIDTPLTPLELNYCYRDVLILHKFLDQEITNYCTAQNLSLNPCNLPLTSTGYVRRDVQKNFSKLPSGRLILQQTALTEEVYNDISPAFWGGFTHADYKKICVPLQGVGHRDLTSAYPAQFLKCFPYRLTIGDNFDVDLFIKNLDRPNFAMIANITLRGGIHILKHKIPYIPESKCIGKNIIAENGKVLLADEVTLWACECDIKTILKVYRYDELIINKFYWGFKKPLPYKLVQTILRYFKHKTEYKNVEGKEVEYMLAKQLLNGVFGMAGTALKHNKLNIQGLDVLPTDTEYAPAKVLAYQWAIYITAYVRQHLYTFIDDLACKCNDAFIYSDTDSIFYSKSEYTEQYFDEYNRKNRTYLRKLESLYPDLIPSTPEGVPQYLGAFEDEHDDIASFITLGAKRYAITHSDGLTDITFAGLSATKIVKTEDGKRVNGYNTQRLIDIYGSIEKAFIKIKDDNVSLDYVEGIDKLSNYNTIAPYSGTVCGVHVERPCSYVLYGQSTTLSLNEQILKVLAMEGVDDELF